MILYNKYIVVSPHAHPNSPHRGMSAGMNGGRQQGEIRCLTKRSID